MWSAEFRVLLLLAIGCYCVEGNTSFVAAPARAHLNILGVFGHLGKSHFDVFRPLVEELARRGHNVTVVSHYPRTAEAKTKEPLPNYKDISLRSEKIGLFVEVVDLGQVDHSPLRVISELGMLRFMANLACENGLKHPEMLKLVNSTEKFDVILSESFNTNCFLAVVHKFGAPFIYMSSHQLMVWTSGQVGNPHEASYVPTIFQGLQRPLNFINRLINTVTIAVVSNVYEYWYHSLDQALAEEAYGPGLPDLREIASNASGVMVNTHYSLHGTRPHLPNVIEIGGLHIPKKISPLPKDVAKFLDEATEGVLYFNLGSMVKAATMPKDKLEVIVKVFASIPRKVIWKWEAESLPYKLDNVLVKPWLQQFDILNHPNVKCYFGHGGLLGISEGTYAGVPMVLLPIFGDQFHNSAAVEARGAAIVLKFHEFNETGLRHAFDQIFNNTRYRENAQKLSKAYRDRAAGPLETAVWWTEYIARGNGLPYLKSEGANLPWYQRHLVDVALFLLGISLALLYVLYRLGKFLLSLAFAETKRSPNNAATADADAARNKSKKRD